MTANTIKSYASVDDLRAIENPSYVCYSNMFSASIWALTGEEPTFVKIEDPSFTKDHDYVSVFYKREAYYAAVKIMSREATVEPNDFNNKWIILGNKLRELPGYDVSKSKATTPLEDRTKAATRGEQVLHNVYRAAYIYAATNDEPILVEDDKGIGFEFSLPQETIRLLINEFNHGVSNFSGVKFVDAIFELRRKKRDLIKVINNDGEDD